VLPRSIVSISMHDQGGRHYSIQLPSRGREWPLFRTHSQKPTESGSTDFGGGVAGVLLPSLFFGSASEIRLCSFFYPAIHPPSPPPVGNENGASARGVDWCSFTLQREIIPPMNR